MKKGHEDLRPYLKRRHKRRVKKGGRTCRRAIRAATFGPSIDARPTIVEQRSRIGDWESDSVASKNNEVGLNTLVERKTGLLCMTKLKDKTSEATTDVVMKRLDSYPAQTITFDNGSENTGWKILEERLSTHCFFAHPYSSWERGTNENTNGLIRWYFPKGTDFAKVSDKEIMKVEYALNTRPRKRLGYRTPVEVFNESVALES